MQTRKRTKTSGLVSHTTPNGSYPSEESKLQAKFDKGTITKDELKKLASFMVVRKKKTAPTEVKIFGTWTPISRLNLSVTYLRSQNFELR
jgi:hypothetical protein